MQEAGKDLGVHRFGHDFIGIAGATVMSKGVNDTGHENGIRLCKILAFSKALG
jgi:hypothetical protein